MDRDRQTKTGCATVTAIQLKKGACLGNPRVSGQSVWRRLKQRVRVRGREDTDKLVEKYCKHSMVSLVSVSQLI